MEQTHNLLRLKDSADFLGVSPTSLWRLSQTDSDFPTKIKLSNRCCGYLRSDLEAYLIKKSEGKA